MPKTDILATNNIFIDTSVFESENFIEGRKINELFSLAGKGYIRILISKITQQEVIARMKKRLHEAKKYIENNKKEMDKNLRILRITDAHKEKFPFAKIRQDEDMESLQRRFEELLHFGKALVVELPVSHQAIFNKYFAEEPPFHKENKKYEFPDAFALAMLEQYCTEQDIVCYVLTHDNDILSYKSHQLITERDIGTLIDKINRHIKERTRLENVARTDAVIKRAIDQFLKRLEIEIDRELRVAITEVDRPTLDVESVNYINIASLRLEDYSILSVGDREAQVEFDVSFSFLIEYDAIDYSSAVYDREEEKWYGEKQIDNDQIDGSMRITVESNVLHTYADGSIGNEIEIISINNGQGLDLEKYY